MPLYYTRTVNGKFHLRDEGREHARPEQALMQAIGAATLIAAEELKLDAHDSCAAVEVSIEDEHRHVMLRSVVTVAHAMLIADTTPLDA